MAANEHPRVLCVKSEAYERDGVIVSVADRGTGISAQHVDRIFNPLFTTKSEGMGMGLSICRAIIEAHEGRLWVSPNTPHGAVFQFTLRGYAEGGGDPYQGIDTFVDRRTRASGFMRP